MDALALRRSSGEVSSGSWHASCTKDQVSLPLRFCVEPLPVWAIVGSSKQAVSASGNGKVMLEGILHAHCITHDHVTILGNMIHVWYAHHTCLAYLRSTKKPFLEMQVRIMSMTFEHADVRAHSGVSK